MLTLFLSSRQRCCDVYVGQQNVDRPIRVYMMQSLFHHTRRYEVHRLGGLAQLVATLVGSTELLYAGPG